LAFFVKVINEPYENIISTFQSDFLNSKVEKILNGVDDIALILEKGKKDEKNENIILGPYSSKKDNEMSQLIPFKSIEILKDPNTVGRMVKVQLFEITSDINFTKLKNVIGQVNNYKKYL
jgi:CRISPR/Cas system Type II protein with McrA/HNH and RuvC-like nuclease domain